MVRNIERKERQWEAMMDETVARVAPQALGRQDVSCRLRNTKRVKATVGG